MQSQSQYDKMTTMPVSRLILQLAIPSTLTMLITTVYNLVDTYFVGQLGTNSASGAVGIVFSIMALLQAFGFLFGHGSGSVASRMLGSKRETEASRVGSVAIACGFFSGILIAVLGLMFIKPLLYLMGSTDTIYPYAKQYASCIFLAAPFILTSFSLNNLLRYQGKAKYGLMGIGTGAVLNMALDPILMFGLHMGILGAGVATAVSQTLGFFILLALYQSKETPCTFRLGDLAYIQMYLAEIARTGLPSLVRQGIGSISTMVLNNQAAIYGDAAVAAMSIVGRISMLLFAVGLGIGQGFQPVAGFNYGAGRYDRVKKGFLFTLGLSEAFLGVLAILGMAVSGRVIGIFRDDAQVVAIGSRALFLQCAAIFFAPGSICTNMLLQSTGKSTQATITALFKNGLCFLPFILILPLFLGLSGIQMSQPIADVLSCLLSLPFAVGFFRTLDKEQEKKQQ